MTTVESDVQMLVELTPSAMVPGFKLSNRLLSLNNKKVGFIDDAKENAKELLEEFASVLNEKYEVSCQLYHQKPAAGKPTEPAMIEKIAEECDFVIVAIGS